MFFFFLLNKDWIIVLWYLDKLTCSESEENENVDQVKSVRETNQVNK